MQERASMQLFTQADIALYKLNSVYLCGANILQRSSLGKVEEYLIAVEKKDK